MPIVTKGGVVLCGQDLRDPAVGALQQWVSPEDRILLAEKTFIANINEEGWITSGALCEKHLQKEEAKTQKTVPKDQIRRITVEQYLAIEAAHGNTPEVEITESGMKIKENK